MIEASLLCIAVNNFLMMPDFAITAHGNDDWWWWWRWANESALLSALAVFSGVIEVQANTKSCQHLVVVSVEHILKPFLASKREHPKPVLGSYREWVWSGAASLSGSKSALGLKGIQDDRRCVAPPASSGHQCPSSSHYLGKHLVEFHKRHEKIKHLQFILLVCTITNVGIGRYGVAK